MHKTIFYCCSKKQSRGPLGLRGQKSEQEAKRFPGRKERPDGGSFGKSGAFCPKDEDGGREKMIVDCYTT